MGEYYLEAWVLIQHFEGFLVKLVKSATTESGETDTAKWMTAGREGK